MSTTTYRITGLVGDSEGRAVRRTITTARTRKEAIHVARRIKNDRHSNFTKIRIEPVSASKGRGPMERMEDDAAAKRARERRAAKGRIP